MSLKTYLGKHSLFLLYQKLKNNNLLRLIIILVIIEAHIGHENAIKLENRGPPRLSGTPKYQIDFQLRNFITTATFRTL